MLSAVPQSEASFISLGRPEPLRMEDAVGWLAIACICGFFGYRCWRLASDWLLQQKEIGNAQIAFVVMTCVTVFAVLVLYATWSSVGLVVGLGIGFAGYRGWRWIRGRPEASDIVVVVAFVVFLLIALGPLVWSGLPHEASGRLSRALEGSGIAVVALVLGLAIGVLKDWQRVSPRLVQKYPVTAYGADTLIGLLGLIVLLLGLALWAIMGQEARTPGEIADALQHGRVARFVLGLVLGLGAAAVMADRPRVAAPAGDIGGQAGAASSEADAKRDLPMLWIFSTGLSIAVLALAAPHLDDWLRRTTGFKSPYVELQLASASTHKISVDEGAELLLSTDSLSYLAVYDTKIGQDIEYLKSYGQDISDHDKIVPLAGKLLPTFNQVFGPIAKCVQSAIDHEWLSVDSARQMLRPTANAAEEIIFAEDTLTKADQLDSIHEKFWRGVLALPGDLAKAVKQKECDIVVPEYDHKPSGDSPDLFPRLQGYQELPYLYVAAALLSSFMGDNDKALRILQMAESKLIFKDYFFLLLKARLSYYNGKPGDIRQSYLGALDEMRSMARSHIDALEKKNLECTSPDNTVQICRDLLAEIQAKNYAAYYIAEDLARGSAYVGPYVARLQEYVDDIKRAIDEPVSNYTLHKGFYQILRQGLYNRYLPYRHAMLDTYAYALLVLEARKPSPDYDLIRYKLIPIFTETTDTLKSLYEDAGVVKRESLYQIKVADAHLASAREFIGE